MQGHLLLLLISLPSFSDAPVMMAGGAAAAPAAAVEEEEARAAVQTSFALKLKAFDAAKKVPLSLYPCYIHRVTIW